MDQTVASHAPGRGLITTAALALVWWGITAFFFFVYIPSYRCRGDLCGLGLIGPTLFLVGTAILLSAVAGAWALSMALRKRERLAAISFGILLAAAAFAAYALWYNGNPGHPLIAAVYGLPYDGFGLHPFAFYGSVALIPAIALVALAYALTRGKARQISAAAGPLAVLGLWIAIRIAG